MRKTAELYSAWILGVLTTCGLAYWFYRQNNPTNVIRAEDISTDDTDDTEPEQKMNNVRPRFIG